MNQKGEVTFTFILLMVVINSVLLLFGLRLHFNWLNLENRSKVFLCAKEYKEESSLFINKVEKLNWVIKNTDQAQKVAMFIPYLWPYVGKAEKVKTASKFLQSKYLADYLITITKLKKKKCPIPLGEYTSPYILGANLGFQRDQHDQAKLRKKTWNAIIKLSNHQVQLQYKIVKKGLWKTVEISSSEKMARAYLALF